MLPLHHPRKSWSPGWDSFAKRLLSEIPTISILQTDAFNHLATWTGKEVSTGVAPASPWLRTKATYLIVHETIRGRRDLNPRPFARQATALDQLSYTPKYGKYSVFKVQKLIGCSSSFQLHYIYTTNILQNCQGHTTKIFHFLLSN